MHRLTSRRVLHFCVLPIPDGDAPTLEQAENFVRFVAERRAEHRPVAVHCEAGLGRTGTMLATYLISQGDTAESAIRRVRPVEKVAIETPRQILFLEQYAEIQKKKFDMIRTLPPGCSA